MLFGRLDKTGGEGIAFEKHKNGHTQYTAGIAVECCVAPEYFSAFVLKLCKLQTKISLRAWFSLRREKTCGKPNTTPGC